MGKLEVGMKFPSLKQAFQFLGIEDEYYGQRKKKCFLFKRFRNIY